MASEIIPNLFLGDIADARRWQGIAVTVLEYRPPELPTKVIHIPIVDTNPGATNPDEVRVILAQLEALVTLVDAALSRGERVLASCGQGVERSSLAVVWYLFRRKGMGVEKAYRMVREKRPQVIEHLEWLHGDALPPRTPGRRSKGSPCPRILISDPPPSMDPTTGGQRRGLLPCPPSLPPGS